MNEHADNHLIAAHETRMTRIEMWCEKIERKVDKIPWILLVVVINICLSLVQLVLKR